MDRQEKINRIAEAGQNICTNFFFSNAERMMRILEEKDCDELKISLQMKLEKKETDGINGVGKVEFGSPNITIDKSTKFKDKYDDVVLDFVNPDLPGLDEEEKPGKKKKDAKQVAGQIVEPLLLTDGEPESDEEIFKKAIEWYNTTPEWEEAGGKFANRTIVKLQRVLNITYNQAASAWDRIIDSIVIPEEKSEYDNCTFENFPTARKPRKPRKKKADTMKVERDLTEITNPACCREDLPGCCLCQEEDCPDRYINFGAAYSCTFKTACSQDCPRLIK